MDRKQFLSRSLQFTAGAFLAGNVLARDEREGSRSEGSDPFGFQQIPLPYAYEALEPWIDRQTMEIHYGKHHNAYVKNVNEAITAEGISATSEGELFASISGRSAKVRNNGGGAWNHNFFWQVMRPAGGPAPAGRILDAITGSFGDLDKFKAVFSDAAMGRFGSGWAWLVARDGKLTVGSMPNQDNPLMDVSEIKGSPLLALDVWEHAYYLKYQNKRKEYIDAWWNVVNWEEVARRLA